MKICLVISSMARGGAERVLSHMANWWAERSAEVEFIKFDSRDNQSVYKLHPRVVVHSLGILEHHRRGIGAFLKAPQLLLKLRQQILEAQPDVVISFLTGTNIFTCLALLGSSTPLVISERLHPKANSLSLPWRMLRRMSYPLCNLFVAQDATVLPSFSYLQQRAVVIPNPVAISHAKTSNERLPLVVAMGRLHEQKGFDLLLRAFAQICEEFPTWNLEIYGEGPQEVELKALIQELKLEARASLRGITKDPFEVFHSCAVFALPSRFEGFPNVLVEAMACGSTVLVRDCPGAIHDIVQHDQNGLIVGAGSTAEIADGLRRLLSDQALRARLSAQAIHVEERYSIDSVMQQWEKAIASMHSLHS